MVLGSREYLQSALRTQMVDTFVFWSLSLRRNKKQTAVINLRKYRRISEKRDFNLMFRMFQRASSEVINRRITTEI